MAGYIPPQQSGGGGGGMPWGSWLNNLLYGSQQQQQAYHAQQNQPGMVPWKGGVNVPSNLGSAPSTFQQTQVNSEPADPYYQMDPTGTNKPTYIPDMQTAAGAPATPAGGGGGGAAGDPNQNAYWASMIAANNQATQYQQAQMDLANRRFSWEQSQAQAAAEAAKQQRESGAADNYNKMVLGYMDNHPITGAAISAGYYAPAGQAGSRAMAPNADLMQYYKDHPEAGSAPGTGAVPVGYTGAQSVGAGDGATHLQQPMSAQNIAPITQGTTGINLPDFMYGNRTAVGTPVPLGPQQEAAMANNKQNANAFNDYAGNYAGFDPSTLLNQSGGGGANNPLKNPTTFPGQGM